MKQPKIKTDAQGRVVTEHPELRKHWEAIRRAAAVDTYLRRKP